jgi:hypothetical protein
LLHCVHCVSTWYTRFDASCAAHTKQHPGYTCSTWVGDKSSTAEHEQRCNPSWDVMPAHDQQSLSCTHARMPCHTRLLMDLCCMVSVARPLLFRMPSHSAHHAWHHTTPSSWAQHHSPPQLVKGGVRGRCGARHGGHWTQVMLCGIGGDLVHALTLLHNQQVGVA